MRVAIFFDGKNFYAGWRGSSRPRIDFPALARWVVRRAGGTTLWGAHYFTALETGEGADTQAQEALRSYLDMLDLQPGFFVHRFPRKPMGTTCPGCGAPQRINQETAVDTAMAAEAVRQAATGAYDTLVLVSGDGDHTPIVDAVRALGRQVYVATWGRASLSRYLRLAAFDHIDFLDGVAEFVEGGAAALPDDAPGDVPEGTPAFAVDSDPIDHFVQEVRRAQAKFDEGYVGLHYFLTRWKSDRLDPSAEVRRRILDDAVERGVVEIYEARDGAKAVRATDGERSPEDEFGSDAPDPPDAGDGERRLPRDGEGYDFGDED
jgi:uncharacterized LabA/DUF88 family protein